MKKKATPPVVEAIETAAPAEDTTPKCPECQKVLDWRDAAYVLGSNLCKRCHQREAKKQLQGDFHPAVQMVQRGKQLVAEVVRNNRAQRRSAGLRNAPIPLYAPWRPEAKRMARGRVGTRAA